MLLEDDRLEEFEMISASEERVMTSLRWLGGLLMDDGDGWCWGGYINRWVWLLGVILIYLYYNFYVFIVIKKELLLSSNVKTTQNHKHGENVIDARNADSRVHKRAGCWWRSRGVLRSVGIGS